MRSILLLSFLALFAGAVTADGPGDNVPDNVRPIPPKGSVVPEADAKELRAGMDELRKALEPLEKAAKPSEFLPDVQIYEKAVRWALDDSTIYIDEKSKRNDASVAKALLKKGLERAKELAELKANARPSWAKATGLVVRGYRSRIDGSVQPYGLVIPDDYDFQGKDKSRLDFWWHGRYENNLELSFIAERQRSRGEFSQPGVITVHPFGRFSNANKFAGEADTFEVLNHVKKNYRIDEKRLVARGFSMGGAACWQFATHFPTFWCAAAPGAGFAETKEFLGNFQNEKVKPEWWEEKLWRMYDATEYAENLFNLPTIAYSGENDRQKQAADIMVKYAKAAGLEFPHIIGKGAGHNYTNDAKKEINSFVDAAATKGLPAERKEVKFTTYTLRYNECGPFTIRELLKHWEPARITATFDSKVIDITTKGIKRFWIELPKGEYTVNINGKLALSYKSSSGFEHRFTYGSSPDRWGEDATTIKDDVKRPGHQGPIDDAFLDSFLFVRPTGAPLNDTVGKWADNALKHAQTRWHNQMRGDAPIKDDTDITEADIENNNLILWGDPKSNAILAKIANKLPLMDKFGETTVPVLIYPNPMNPKKYVVLNSGFTYREYDDLNNARQVPKLPDYAIIDVTTKPNSRYPGKITRAGFFDEAWKLQPNDGK